MGSVYSSAYLTVCALFSSDCTTGFLDRSSTAQVPFQSSRKSRIAGIYQLRLLPTDEGNRYDLDASLCSLDESSSTWRKRAWTYQESELSRRKLLFGRTRLHLSLPGSLVTELELQHPAYNFPQYPECLVNFSKNGNCEILYNHWHEIVSSYACRDFSNENDVFPGITGLATLMAKYLKDEYIAGLWRNDLIRGLLWSPMLVRSLIGLCLSLSELLDRLPRPCSVAYICPSWSWAKHRCFDYNIQTQHHRNIVYQEQPEHSFRSEYRALMARSWPESKMSTLMGAFGMQDYMPKQDAYRSVASSILSITANLGSHGMSSLTMTALRYATSTGECRATMRL
jgi:hypothetical protein